MAAKEAVVRIDLTYAQLEALAWAVWFSAPAAREDDQATLDEIEAVLLQRRRRLRQAPLPRPSEQPEPGPEPLPGTGDQE